MGGWTGRNKDDIIWDGDIYAKNIFGTGGNFWKNDGTSNISGNWDLSVSTIQEGSNMNFDGLLANWTQTTPGWTTGTDSGDTYVKHTTGSAILTQNNISVVAGQMYKRTITYQVAFNAQGSIGGTAFSFGANGGAKTTASVYVTATNTNSFYIQQDFVGSGKYYSVVVQKAYTITTANLSVNNIFTTDRVYAGNGTTSLPSYTFSSATGTGFSLSSGTLSLSFGGSQAAEINTTESLWYYPFNFYNTSLIVENLFASGGKFILKGGAHAYLRSDSSLLYFGAGDDATINYDGTNMIINPKVVGSGYLEIQGDTIWTGSGNGLPYGSCYGNEIAWSQASAAQNTWYNVSDTDMTDGQLNLVTHDGSGKLTTSKAGKYLINYSASVSCSANNHHIEGGIYTSGGAANDGQCSWYPQTANAEGVVNSTAILNLGANATIEFCIRTATAGTPTLSVNHLNITMVMVGA